MAAAETIAAVQALREGRAFVDLSSWRKVWVRGGDALTWLNDLVTADLSGLGPNEATRSLLLTPRGRIRADFTVAAFEDGFLLVQEPAVPVDGLLAPYVLSSDVSLQDRTEALALVALPGADRARDPDVLWWSPSSLGPGTDAAATTRPVLDRVLAGRTEAGPEAVEAWRIERGRARFGLDLTEESLPHEADLGPAVALDKGCYLGQEAVAKVRNLGHPPFVVLAVRADGPIGRGEPVTAAGQEVGRITSATPTGEGSAALARIRWAARHRALTTASGVPLTPSPV
jgi:folate-binding protein YgfZ